MTAPRAKMPDPSGRDDRTALAPALFEAIVNLDGPSARVVCSGELNVATSDILRDVLWLAVDHASRSAAAECDGACVELDLRAVSPCTSSGLKVITEAFRDAAERGVPIHASHH